MSQMQRDFEQSTRGGLAITLFMGASMFVGLWFTMLGATVKHLL